MRLKFWKDGPGSVMYVAPEDQILVPCTHCQKHTPVKYYWSINCDEHLCRECRIRWLAYGKRAAEIAKAVDEAWERNR